MTAKLVRLKLPSESLARVKARELRLHLEAEVSKLPCGFRPGDGNKMIDTTTFLLTSPLFLYTIGPRVRLANSHLYKSKPDDAFISVTHTMEPRHLSITTAHGHDCCFTQLRYGASVLIDARELAHTHERHDNHKGEFKKSVQHFYEEIEFLGYEYRAREQAAAEILGRELVKSVESKVVKLKVGNNGLAALAVGEYSGVLK